MAFGFSVCSFGRDFVGCASGLPSSRSPSLRRVLRVFLAARRRWPAGRLVVSLGSVRWDVDGSCGVMLSLGRDGFGRPDVLDRLRARVLLPRDFRAEIDMFGLDVPRSGLGFWREWLSCAWSCVRGPSF